MLKIHSFIIFLLLFFITIFGKYISPSSLGLKREKLSHLHFYFPDVVFGKNATVVRVTTSTNRSSSLLFSDVFFIDDLLTTEPDVNLRMVGKTQGAYALVSLNELSLLMVISFAFTKGKYNSSTLSVLRCNEIFSAVREMPIVGESGLFRFA
ncbi:hypothetical protein V6Z12_A04G152200 [Gossypium hirsutum]